MNPFKHNCQKSQKLTENTWKRLTDFGGKLKSIKDITDKAEKVIEDQSLEVIESDKAELSS
jgi:hypothetical protein